MLFDNLMEGERRKVMVNRLILYSCVTHGQWVGMWDMLDQFDEDTLRRARRRLEETPTQELQQIITHLFAQVQQVYILVFCRLKE